MESSTEFIGYSARMLVLAAVIAFATAAALEEYNKISRSSLKAVMNAAAAVLVVCLICAVWLELF